MYHPPSKRKQFIRSTIIISLSLLSIATIVTIMVFIMLGYRYDKQVGKIEQGGLVQFSSVPGDATITVDNTSLTTKTPYKKTLSHGVHSIQINKDGYRQWNKDVDVLPGKVLWINYARLIPNDVETNSVVNLSGVSGMLTSLDSKTIAIKEKTEDGSVRLVDISGDNVKTNDLVIPDGLYTKSKNVKKQKFIFHEWARDNRYLLVKHEYDNSYEWLVIDTRKIELSKNISRIYSTKFSKVIFGNNSKVLFSLSNGIIKRLDISKSESLDISNGNVADFSLYSKSSAIVSQLINKKKTIGVLNFDTKVFEPVYSSKNLSESLNIALGEYYDEIYYAVGHDNTVDISKAPDQNYSKTTSISSIKAKGNVVRLSIVNNGRFVFVQDDKDYVYIYDNELNETYNTLIKNTASVNQKLRLLDGYHIWSDRDGTLSLCDYDGANKQDIVKVDPGHDIALSQNSEYLYSINKTTDGAYYLQRTKMILDK